MTVKETQELLDKVADDASKDAIERFGGDEFVDAAVRAIFAAGWKAGEAQGFRSGHNIGRSSLSVGWFFAVVVFISLASFFGGFVLGVVMDLFVNGASGGVK